MEFLKSLFEKGALTWEQFQQAAKDAKFEVVNAAGGAYVPKADLDTKAQELTTANNTIKDLRAAAKAWDGKDPKKLEDDLRNLQTKYDTDTVADRETKSVDLKIFGGTFKIDRVLANTANGQINEVQFQLEEHIKATTNLFHYTAINGDKGTKGFDGLDTLLVGTSTEINADASKAIDLSTSAAIDTNYKTVLDMLDEFLSELDGVPTMLIGNAALLTKIRSCARRAGYLTHAEDAFGRQMSGYNGIPFMDMQYYYDAAEKKEKPVVPIVTRSTTSGLTDLYAVRLGLDGFHAVSPMGGKVISTTLPDFSTAGPVKAGDVEMVAATVLKKSRAAGVLRNFKVK